jgi:putative transposase
MQVMPQYRRAWQPGGTFFFTLVTEGRVPLFARAGSRALLHQAVSVCRTARPFVVNAAVLLPDHLHLILTLPPGDADFSTRLSMMKSHFTRLYLRDGGSEWMRSTARRRQEYRGVWQRRFWEHCLCDDRDLHAHLDYIHYNPVKHGLANCPHEWPYSSFQRHVRLNAYEPDWLCRCQGGSPVLPCFDGLACEHME